MPKKLYGELKGPFDWNSAIYDKLSGMTGVYVINVRKRNWGIDYPHGMSNIIYIGQSHDIGNRLSQHENMRVNRGLAEYRANHDINVYFKPMNAGSNLEKWEGNMIQYFENKFGRAPICNGQTPNVD
jgi:hypothetical protein